MTDKYKNPELTARQLHVGGVYRAKRFREFMGETNDRTIVWISADKAHVQYDSDTVKIGRRLPVIPIDKFLGWAKFEVVKP